MQLNINKDTSIDSLFQDYPHVIREISEILSSHGLHCFGCSCTTVETLEEGCTKHGLTTLEVMINELNQLISTSQQDAFIGEKEIVTLTPAAQKKIQSLLKQGKKTLRITVLKGGCAGKSYNFSPHSDYTNNDYIQSFESFTLIIDQQSSELLEHTQIDYLDDFNQAGFVFNNPQSTKVCGCGKSFR